MIALFIYQFVLALMPHYYAVLILIPAGNRPLIHFIFLFFFRLFLRSGEKEKIFLLIYSLGKYFQITEQNIKTHTHTKLRF